jgi:hypothetical protein
MIYLIELEAFPCAGAFTAQEIKAYWSGQLCMALSSYQQSNGHITKELRIGLLF